jgi:threonine/homoserine/homoserine lactone efflux protein
VEAILILALALGVVGFLRAPVAVKVIAAVGSALLVYMGVSLLLETVRAKGIQASGAEGAGFASRLSPAVAGVLVSVSNPYWWIWWVTIGAAFLLRYEVTLQSWPALVAFFVGHELGDLGWFLAVSSALSLGRNRIPRGVVAGIQACCGVAIIGFALYLGISTFTGR